MEVEEVVEIQAAAVAQTTGYQLTLDEYRALPKPERQLLRRLAFGMPTPSCFSCTYDLVHLNNVLVAENEATGTFPQRWVDQTDEDEAAYFLRVTK